MIDLNRTSRAIGNILDFSSTCSYGRGRELGRGLGVGVGLGVEVGEAVGLGVGPVTPVPPQTIISLPVQTAVCCDRAAGASAVLVTVQLSAPGLYLPPVFT